MDTVLVIDDDDQLRKSFCKLLKEEKYAVISAASGEAGIEIVKQNVLDLVILDLKNIRDKASFLKPHQHLKQNQHLQQYS